MYDLEISFTLAAGRLFGPDYRYLGVFTTYHASFDGLDNKYVRIYLNAFLPCKRQQSYYNQIQVMPFEANLLKNYFLNGVL